MVEYTQIIKGLLATSSTGKAFSFEGEFYTVKQLKLSPDLPPGLEPEIFVSGSSEAGLAAARTLNAIAVQYPTEPATFADVSLDHSIEYGIRIGIVTREDEDRAWSLAQSRFPPDRKVAELLQTYIDKGFRTFVLDIPPSLEELDHMCRAFECCEVGHA